jgi:predicted dehydrogenase
MSLSMGVIGVDHPHAGGHLQAFEAAPEIERLLIWDADPELAQAAVDQSAKAELAPSEDALFDDPDLPALGIFVRDSEAGSLNLRAIEAGKWVYGDKPGGMSAAELERIVRAAERTGAHFCPCYAHRTFAASSGLTGLFRDRAIGDVWSFEAVWMTSSVALRGPDSWLFHREHSAGGILTWLACHWLDLLRHLFGCEVETVMAMVATKTDAAVDVEDTASLILRFQNGAIGTVRAGYSLDPFAGYLDSDLYMQCEGSEGSLTWLPPGDRSGLTLRSRKPEYSNWTPPPLIPSPKEYGAEMFSGFVRAVQGGGEPPATEMDAWRVMQITEAAHESSATGLKINLIL